MIIKINQPPVASLSGYEIMSCRVPAALGEGGEALKFIGLFRFLIGISGAQRGRQRLKLVNFVAR